MGDEIGRIAMRVLVADDERVSATILGRTLMAWGYDATVVHDGHAAWGHIASDNPPAMVIADWMMPGLDGIELCKQIRATPRPPIYVILLTARTSRQDVVAGLNAGADDYLTKPFDADELRARLHVGERTLSLLASINRLTGLLPICAYCKRIRSDNNYWQQVESYISARTDAQLTHGICPSCMEAVLDDLKSVSPEQ